MSSPRHVVLRALRQCAIAALLGMSLPLAAAPTLDTAFGTNGTLVQHFPGGLTSCGGDRSTAWFVGAKRDQRILANGAYVSQFGNRCAPFWTSATAQYSLKGTPDSAFGTE